MRTWRSRPATSAPGLRSALAADRGPAALAGHPARPGRRRARPHHLLPAQPRPGARRRAGAGPEVGSCSRRDRFNWAEGARCGRVAGGDARRAWPADVAEACMGLSVSSVHRRTPFRCVAWPGVAGRWAECGGRRGARQWRRGSSRRELVCGGSHDPNHDAAMRIGGEAPGRRAHSAPRLGGHACARVTATSDRHRRPATRVWRSAEARCS